MSPNQQGECIVRNTTKNALPWLFIIALGAGCSTANHTSLSPKSSSPRFNLTYIPGPVPRQVPPSTKGNPESYVVFGKRYFVNGTSEGYRERGVASWYGSQFHGKRTSSGPPFNMHAITAAHKTLPIPTFARVTHLATGRTIVVEINDRGPFVDDRIIDLSYAAANQLGIIGTGTGPVEVEALPPFQYLPEYQFGKKGALLAQNRPFNHAKPVSLRNNFVQSPPLPIRHHAAPRYAPSPAPVNHTAAVTPQTVNNSGLYLQVGAFTARQNAELLQNRLATKLTQPIQIDSQPGNLYKVKVGPLQNSAEAHQLTFRLAGLGVSSPYLVIE